MLAGGCALVIYSGMFMLEGEWTVLLKGPYL